MRTLTIVVNIEDTDRAKWIWNSHLNGTEINGVKVGMIVEGDEVTRLENKVDDLYDDLAGEDL